MQKKIKKIMPTVFLKPQGLQKKKEWMKSPC